MNIGIIGVGVVGGAMTKALALHHFVVCPYDISGGFDSPEKIMEECQVLFICVPTPEAKDNSVDLSMVREAVCKFAVPGKNIFIKSTVPPGTTRRFASEFPRTNFAFNPEFLSEDTALEDTINPDKIIIGSDNPVMFELARIIYKDFQAPIFICSYEEAEMIKYFINCFYAMKVIYANQLYDLCESMNIDYSVVKNLAVKDKRITDSHFDVFHKGYRGYGGKCLPKEMKGLIDLADKHRVDLSLLKVADKLNGKLRKLMGERYAGA